MVAVGLFGGAARLVWRFDPVAAEAPRPPSDRTFQTISLGNSPIFPVHEQIPTRRHTIPAPRMVSLVVGAHTSQVFSTPPGLQTPKMGSHRSPNRRNVPQSAVHFQGEILDNAALIEQLEQTKKKASQINKSIKAAVETDANLQLSRQIYTPVAERASLLFFQIYSLTKIDHMYQYSLEAFDVVFNKALRRAKPDDVCTPRQDSSVEFSPALYHPQYEPLTSSTTVCTPPQPFISRYHCYNCYHCYHCDHCGMQVVICEHCIRAVGSSIDSCVFSPIMLWKGVFLMLRAIAPLGVVEGHLGRASALGRRGGRPAAQDRPGSLRAYKIHRVQSTALRE